MVVIYANCVVLVFQVDDLCGIDGKEKRSHVCLYGMWKANFVGHITVEIVLYLNYPTLLRMFSKGLRFNIIWKANFVDNCCKLEKVEKGWLKKALQFHIYYIHIC